MERKNKKGKRKEGLLSKFSCSLGVEDILPGVAVEGLLETLLVKGVADEADGPCKHEEAVEVANVDDVINLGLGEHA